MLGSRVTTYSGDDDMWLVGTVIGHGPNGWRIYLDCGGVVDDHQPIVEGEKHSAVEEGNE